MHIDVPVSIAYRSQTGNTQNVPQQMHGTVTGGPSMQDNTARKAGSLHISMCVTAAIRLCGRCLQCVLRRPIYRDVVISALGTGGVGESPSETQGHFP